MKQDLKLSKHKSKTLKLEQEQFIEFDKNQIKPIQEYLQAHVPSGGTSNNANNNNNESVILLNFFATNNNQQQTIQMKKMESLITKLTKEAIIGNSELYRYIIDKLVWIIFSVGSKHIQVNKSIVNIVNSLQSRLDLEKELELKFKDITTQLLSTTIDNQDPYKVFKLGPLLEMNVKKTIIETRFYKVLQVLGEYLQQHINELEKSDQLNITTTIYDCEQSLKTIVHLFKHNKQIIFHKRLLEFDLSIDNTTDKSKITIVQSVIHTLQRFLLNEAIPKKLVTNSGYALAQLMCLFGGSNQKDIQDQILSSIIQPTSNTQYRSTFDKISNFIDSNKNSEMESFYSKFQRFSMINQLSILRGLGLTDNIKCLTSPISMSDGSTFNIYLNFILKKIGDFCKTSMDQHNRYFSLDYLLCLLKSILEILKDEKSSIEILFSMPYDQFFNSHYQSLMDLVWKNWESTISQIASTSYEIFKILLQIHEITLTNTPNPQSISSSTKSFINTLTLKLIDEDWFLKSKYVLLGELLDRVGPIFMIEKRNDLLKNIFASMIHHTICTSVKVFLELFLKKLKQAIPSDDSNQSNTSDLSKVERYWIHPLLDVLTKTDNVTSSRIILYALPCLLNIFPNSLFKIITLLEEYKELDYNIKLRISLAVLNSARQLALIDGSKLQNDHKTLIEQSLEHQDESLRLLALDLICTSPRNTERVTKKEIAMIKTFLLLNSKGSSPFIRNQILTIIQRFWIRLKESTAKVFRAKTNTNIRVKSDQQSIDDLVQPDDLLEFINWNMEFFTLNLYPDAPFPRKMLPLEGLTHFIDIWSHDFNLDKPSQLVLLKWIQERSNLFSKQTTTILINNLWDNYDRCRELASDILLKFPSPLPGLELESEITPFLLWAIRLCSSPKAKECDTGSFALKLFFKKYVLANGMVPIFHSSQKSPVTYQKIEDPNKASMEYIQQLLRILKSQVNIANVNLLESAKLAPMHGMVLALRYILYEIPYKEKSKDEKKQWKFLLEDIINVGKTISSIVLRVVADLAPEGNIPSFTTDSKGLPISLPSGIVYDDDERLLASNFTSMSLQSNDHEQVENDDQLEDDLEMDEEGEEDEDMDIHKNNEGLQGGIGQIITVCSWQCTKQVSLLLGAILDRVELNDNSQEELVSFKQIQEIGQLFLTTLLTSRHKGAIEKTYLGYQILCSTLLKSNQPSLYSLPSQWLEILFKRVREQSLQITRRSAGLPFAFIGILTGESTGYQETRHLLSKTINTLLSAANVDSNQDCDNEMAKYQSQVHSINILKSIFRARAIFNELDQYLEPTLITVIKAFSSKSWSVRNSATMAFSILVDRVVDSKKLKADKSILNTTTFYHFFSRMPSVYPFLLEYFRNSLAFIQQNQSTDKDQLEKGKVIQSSIYAILVLFSRLQPSNIIHPNDPLSPSQFVPLITQCCQFSSYMVRQISARALVPLVSTLELVPFISGLIDQIPMTIVDCNKTHGYLLQIYHLIKGHIPTFSGKELDQMVTSILSQLSKITWILNQRVPPLSFTLLRIFMILDVKTISISHPEVLKSLLSTCTDELFKRTPTSQDNETPMFFSYLEKCTELVLVFIRNTLLENSNVGFMTRQECTDNLLKLFNSSFYEIKLNTMKFLLKNTGLLEVLDQKSLQSTIIGNMIKPGQNVEIKKKSFKLLGKLTMVSDNDIDLFTLLQDMVWQRNGIQIDSIVLFGHYFQRYFINLTQQSQPITLDQQKILSTWTKMTQTFSQSNQTLELREGVLQSIQSARDILLVPVTPSTPNTLSHLIIDTWFILITLLEDDNESVRNNCTVLVSSVLMNNQKQATILEVSKSMELVFSHLTSLFLDKDYLFTRFIQELNMSQTTENTNSEFSIFTRQFKNTRALFDKEQDNYFFEKMVKVQLIANQIDCHYSQFSKHSAFEGLVEYLKDLLAQGSIWVKSTTESNQSSVWNHWFTFNYQIFLPLYSSLVIFISLYSHSRLQVYKDTLEKVQSNLTGNFKLHPILSQQLSVLSSKFKSNNNLVDGGTSAEPQKQNYFLISQTK
ncbi:hypothetical protein DLAC_09571 [Tieghemostelium lacteum]|uniref:Uncharacterized protein n=1 Tax=Tieghemostelium lacteum TaxID=361077 RepID=A0A151Z6L7_TIELA|nr:hypothetical protein DLAC_09571 [Tieghemostelium lacteum]|eukprot:KYQ89611.1 hypothetical protein DLAC_09571 [Tieghemostelium lacteum]